MLQQCLYVTFVTMPADYNETGGLWVAIDCQKEDTMPQIPKMRAAITMITVSALIRFLLYIVSKVRT